MNEIFTFFAIIFLILVSLLYICETGLKKYMTVINAIFFRKFTFSRFICGSVMAICYFYYHNNEFALIIVFMVLFDIFE